MNPILMCLVVVAALVVMVAFVMRKRGKQQ